jgi:hypothetical protein
MFTEENFKDKDSIKIDSGQYIKAKLILRNKNNTMVNRIRWNPVRKSNISDTIDNFSTILDSYTRNTKDLPKPGPRFKDWTTYRMAVQIEIIFGWGANEEDARRKYLWQLLVVRFDNRE